MARFDKTTSIDIEDIVIDKSKKFKRYEEEHEDEIKEDSIEEEYENKEEPIEEEQNIEDSDTYEEDDLVDDDVSLKDIVKNDYQEKTMADIDMSNLKKIGVACDHRGYKLKQKLTNYLTKKGYTVVDYGGDGIEGDDYTEFGFKLGEAVRDNKVEKGIAICGSGIGISIACNKVSGVRCAKVVSANETKWTRRDNDANIIALSAKTPVFRAKDIVDVFLKTKFSGLNRHQKRIDELNNYR